MEPLSLGRMAATAFAAYKYIKQEQRSYIVQSSLLACGNLSNFSCLSVVFIHMLLFCVVEAYQVC